MIHEKWQEYDKNKNYVMAIRGMRGAVPTPQILNMQQYKALM